jgi:molybdopterin-binding protein
MGAVPTALPARLAQAFEHRIAVSLHVALPENIMKIGARNRLEGDVTEIKRGSVMCQVKVKIAGGAIMESVMTIDSLDELGIKVGDKVRVAVKAVNVMLIKD